MATKLKRPRLVEIHWDDAWSGSGWRVPADIDHTALVATTVGYMIKSTRLGVTVAGSLADNGDYGSISFRPRGMIRKIRRLR